MDRSRNIVKISIIGIVVNLILVGFKAVVGMVTGSIAVIMDAVNNLSDALSSVITIIGTKLAGRAPDRKHPYGYGRIEHISSISIAVIVLIAALTSLKESVEKVIHPEAANYTGTALIIIAVAVVIKFLLGRYVKAKGKKYNSEALVASGTDAVFDSIISLSTLVAAGISMLFHLSVEGYLGIIISAFILKAGVEILLESLSSIIGDRVDSGLSKRLKAYIREFPGVNGAYDLALHRYGPEKIIGSVHIEVADSMTAREIHHLSQRIMTDVHKDFGIGLTVGLYATNESDEETLAMKQQLREIIKDNKYIIQMHGFYVDFERRTMTFDLVVDFKVPDRIALRDGVIAQMAERYPDYAISANMDIDYSD